MNRLAPPCPTASKLALAFACPASVLLQQGVPDEPSPDVEWGRLVHAGAEALAKGSDVATALGNVIDWDTDRDASKRARFGAVLEHIKTKCLEDEAVAARQEYCAVLWQVEPGYAYNLRTGDVRGPFTREPGEAGGPWEVCGSADLVFRRADGVLVVADWKPDAGKTARVGSMAEDHHQLYFLALCASRVHGAGAGVRVELRYYSEDGVRIDGAELDEADLALFEADLLSLAKRLAEYPAPVPGWHCEGMHCRARATCPATTALAERTTTAVRQFDPKLLWRVAATPQEAREQYEAIHAFKHAVGLLEEHVQAYALAQGPIPVAPGIELVARTARGRDEVNDTAEALIIAEEEIKAATTDSAKALFAWKSSLRVSSTKALIMRAWGAVTGKKLTGVDARRFVERLRERGVLRQGAPSIRLEERRAGAVDTTGEEVET